MPLDVKALIGEPTPPWAIIAERKIQKWVDEGGPERLSNKGRKLDLGENPFVPSELRMAYKIMKNADVAPDWIEIGRELERELTGCREALLKFRHLQRNDRLSLRTATAVEAQAIHERLRLRASHFREEHRARVRNVNHLTERFNTACPVFGLHRVKLDLDRELAEALRG